MRALIACLVLAGCVTNAPPRTPPERLAGCWSGAVDGIMRWSPDPARAGVLQGVLTSLTHQREQYSLEPQADAWRLCSAVDNHCWGVAQGMSGSLEGGRAFIDAEGDELRITIAGDGPQRVIFQGHRRNCA